MIKNSSRLFIACVAVSSVGSNPLFDSGLIATFVKVTGSHSHGIEVFYLPYMEKGQVRPQPGQECRVSYHFSKLNGIVGSESAVIDGAKIIQEISCN